MPKPKRPQTLGALRKSKYEVISVRNELRKNLIAKIRSEEAVFPGIVGFVVRLIPNRKMPYWPVRTSYCWVSVDRQSLGLLEA